MKKVCETLLIFIISGFIIFIIKNTNTSHNSKEVLDMEDKLVNCLDNHDDLINNMECISKELLNPKKFSKYKENMDTYKKEIKNFKDSL
tara:strand:+ start:10623 stop:10889 length:267 start_codon:yes stop_codon:yes gene_type:complete